MKEKSARQMICETGRRIWEKNWVASNDGNLSVLLEDRNIMITPAGVSKGFMKPEMLTIIDKTGRVIDGKLEPSSEYLMHLAIYDKRKDVCGIVHAHPPVTTGFSVAGMALDFGILPEILTTLGEIPLAPFAIPSTPELPSSIIPLIEKHDAVMLSNHGLVTVGNDLESAYFKMERVEHYAAISLTALQLGKMRKLTSKNISVLKKMRDET